MIHPVPLRFSELSTALDRIEENGGGFDRAIDLARDRLRCGKVFFIGNGGSAAIASHMAADWMKTAGFMSMCFNDGALTTCLSNDIGFHSNFAFPIERFGEPIDLLVAISSSGRSQNILNGVTIAKKLDIEVITMSGFDEDNQLRGLGDVNFYVPSHHYGTVEISHLAICHHILDSVVESSNSQ